MDDGWIYKKDRTRKTRDMFFKWAEATGNADKVKGWDRALASKNNRVGAWKVQIVQGNTRAYWFFFKDSVEYIPEAVEKTLKNETAKMVLVETTVRLKDWAILRPRRLRNSPKTLPRKKD